MAHIGNKELLEYIAMTEKEVEAYRMISEGHAILARLNGSGHDRLSAQKYDRLLSQCRDLLGWMNKLKTERGL